jgi:hypothetical protein
MSAPHPGARRAISAHWDRARKKRGRPAEPMTREAELAAIARFEAERGIEPCAPAEVEDSIAPVPTTMHSPMPGWR